MKIQETEASASVISPISGDGAADGERRSSSVAKVSHTLTIALARRLEHFAFFQRISESSVIEYALERFFEQGGDEALGELLRSTGAGRRRKT